MAIISSIEVRKLKRKLECKWTDCFTHVMIVKLGTFA